jgi:UDP:flavonoid glycosyltransferase YjiC (YdhE family)
VRVLFSFAGGGGHFFPTVPLARSLAERGHEVMYTCQEAMVGSVAAQGWRVVPSGGATLLGPGERRPLVPVDRLAEERVVRTFFAGRLARTRAPRLLEIAGDWRPDLIVHDEMDFAAAVAAECLDLPHAGVIVIAAGGFSRPEIVGEPLAELRKEHGLDPEDALTMLHRYLTIVPVPPSYRNPRDPLPSTAHHVRPAVLEAYPDLRPEAGAAGPSRRPRVYFTLGTVFPQESGDLFSRVLEGVGDLPVDVVVTVGQEIDTTEVGDQPANVRMEQFLPLEHALAHTDVVLSHGGSGTAIAALSLGIPQVLLPMGADQPQNADRCTQLGVGEALDVMTSTSDDIAAATLKVIRDASYRANARLLSDEAYSLPCAGHAASLIEGLGSSRAPVTS